MVTGAENALRSEEFNQPNDQLTPEKLEEKIELEQGLKECRETLTMAQRDHKNLYENKPASVNERNP